MSTLSTILSIVGVIVVLALAVVFAVFTCKSKKPDVFKWVLIIIFVGVCLTWIIPSGSFASDGTYTAYDTLTRIGLTNVRDLLFYAMYYPMPTILLLLSIGGFYGLLSATGTYKELVKKLGAFVKKHAIVSSIVIMVVLIVLTSVLSKSPFCMFIFIPFLISVLLNANFDKLTTIAITFGSVLVGQLAATFGPESVNSFNYYMGNTYADPDLTIGMTYRLIIGGIAAVLFILYNVYRVCKVVKNEKNNDVKEDLYELKPIEHDEEEHKHAAWPMVIVMCLTLLFVILAYVDWSKIFGLEVFNDLHKLVTEYSPFLINDKEFPIFYYILGSSKTSAAFGSMDILSTVTYLIVMSVFVALFNRLSVSDYLSSVGDGIKRFIKPIGIYVLTYAIFLIIYTSPFTTSLTGWMYNWSNTYVPYISILDSLVTSIFHSADIGYTSFTLTNIYGSIAVNHLPIIEAIYVTTNGLVQLFAPVSGVLLIGLTYLNVDYKKWLKYIWLYALVVLVVIALVATLAVYVIK